MTKKHELKVIMATMLVEHPSLAWATAKAWRDILHQGGMDVWEAQIWTTLRELGIRPYPKGGRTIRSHMAGMALKGGRKQSEIARELGVSRQWIHQLSKRMKENAPKE